MLICIKTYTLKRDFQNSFLIGLGRVLRELLDHLAGGKEQIFFYLKI